jgi:hypothetical protein
LVIDNHYVSGVQVSLSAEGTDLVVTDGDGRDWRSRNGTRVNGHVGRTMQLTADATDTTLGLGPEITVTIARADVPIGTQP